jgi:hypothetical protein
MMAAPKTSKKERWKEKAPPTPDSFGGRGGRIWQLAHRPNSVTLAGPCSFNEVASDDELYGNQI